MRLNIFKVALLSGAALLTLSTFAHQPNDRVTIDNLGGKFQNDRGLGQVDAWTLPGREPQGRTQFTLFKESDQFRIQTDESEFLWEGAPDFLLDLESAQWGQISAAMDAQSLYLEVGNLSGKNLNDSLVISRLQAGCTGQSFQQKLILRFLETCSHGGDLNFEKVIWQGRNPFTQGKLSLRGGQFDFSLKAKLDFKVKIKGNGHLSFKETPDGGEVWLRLDKVKASFLTITEKVFKEVEGLNSPHTRVQRPYIIVEWKDAP